MRRLGKRRSRDVLLGVRVSARIIGPTKIPSRGAASFITMLAEPAMKGPATLIIALATVVILLIALPAYRLFFVISLGIAAIVVAILHFWHKLRPVRLDDPDDKHPLKLS